MKHFEQKITTEEIQDILNNLQAIRWEMYVMDEGYKNNKLYLLNPNAFDFLKVEANEEIENFPKLQKEKEQEFQENLFLLIDFKYNTTKILDEIDKDIIWDYMEDDIEDYLNNNCKERVKKWED